MDAARASPGGASTTPQRGHFVFRAQLHDPGAKEVFGLSLPAGGGKDDGDRLLDHLAAQPATARRISLRLAQRFVPTIRRHPWWPACALAFLQSDGDIRRGHEDAHRERRVLGGGIRVRQAPRRPSSSSAAPCER